MEKTKVLMVCLGNICRSPLAQGILEAKVDPSQVFVDSAGTGGWHAGEAPDPRSIEVAHKYGIDISGQKARKFTKADLDTFDHIYAMDQSNFNNIIALATSPAQRDKVKLLLDSAINIENTEVPDPYYGGKQGFEDVYSLIDLACTKIASEL